MIRKSDKYNNLKIEGADIPTMASQLLFIEDVLITKSLMNKHGTCEFVTYAQAPTSFKIIDYCKDNDCFFGCIIMVSAAGLLNKNHLIEKYNFNKMVGFQIIGHAPGT